jgi:hypothetical protein
MEIQIKREVIIKLSKLYKQAGKKEKGNLLNELIRLTGYNRSYARRVLRKPSIQKQNRRKKASSYLCILVELQMLWKASNYCCGQLLVAALPQLLHVLKRDGNLVITEEQEKLLLQISSATIDRLLKPERNKLGIKGRSGTKPGTLLKSQIPVRIYTPWDERKPGFVELDLVAHCGDSLRGEYINTLDVVDLATGWSERHGLVGKGEYRTQQAFLALEKRFPFPIKGIDSDNGSEFINDHFLRLTRKRRMTFTRCRPGRKNDQAHVEQKNYSTVRKIIGYKRLETEEQLRLLNNIYVLLSDYLNFFIPTFKLEKKERIGAKIKRVYGKPKTPYQRTLEHPKITDETKQKLMGKYRSLNPVALLLEINKQNKLLSVS